MIRIAPVHRADPIWTWVHKFRQDKEVSQYQINPEETDAHQYLIDLIWYGYVPVGIILIVFDVLQERVGSN